MNNARSNCWVVAAAISGWGLRSSEQELNGELPGSAVLILGRKAIDHQRTGVIEACAADAACWAMQRTRVQMLVRKGLMTERDL